MIKLLQLQQQQKHKYARFQFCVLIYEFYATSVFSDRDLIRFLFFGQFGRFILIFFFHQTGTELQFIVTFHMKSFYSSIN